MSVIHILSKGIYIIYTRVERGQDGMEVKSRIDVVLVKKDMMHYVQDVRGMR